MIITYSNSNKFSLRLLLVLLSLSFSIHTALSQTTASISGHVVSATGRALRGLVALRPAGGGAVRQGFTDLNGAFSFSQLPAGQYTFCARIPGEQSPSPGQPYLDTCMWEQPQNPVQAAAGQSAAGIQVIVPQAVVLQVQVNDPEGLLPQVTAAQMAQTLDTQLQVVVRQIGRLSYRIPFVSQNSTGRTYSLIVPAGAALLLTVKSASASVVDQSGLAVQGEINVPTPTGSALNPFQFTVQH